ncbi:hypothetical protein KY325_00400 [Candidatus Woesearchaeota archaeon]|nr:hypothetical protein [Candidatus Woesearchaeota archaeon]MBW3017605.1 hypothetical protein [Candidatus Woesearchaeota archaeon]
MFILGNWGGYIVPSSAAVALSVLSLSCVPAEKKQTVDELVEVPLQKTPITSTSTGEKKEAEEEKTQEESLEELCDQIVSNVYQYNIKQAEVFYKKAAVRADANKSPLFILAEARFFNEWHQRDQLRKGRDFDAVRRHYRDIVAKLETVFLDDELDKSTRAFANFLAGTFYLRLARLEDQTGHKRRASEYIQVAANNLTRALDYGNPFAHADMISLKILAETYAIHTSLKKPDNQGNSEIIKKLIDELDLRERMAGILYSRGLGLANNLNNEFERAHANAVLHTRYAFYNLQLAEIKKEKEKKNQCLTTAERLLLKAIESNPKYERGHNILGATYLKFADLTEGSDQILMYSEKALAEFRKASELCPNDSAIYCNMLDALSRKAGCLNSMSEPASAAFVLQEVFDIANHIIQMSETWNVPEKDMDAARSCIKKLRGG